MTISKTLTGKRLKFAREYAEHGNQSKAYRAAYNYGGSLTQACKYAHEILRDPDVQTTIQELKKESISDLALDLRGVLENWSAIAKADPNDLVQVVHTACRHCYGIDHAYQWTQPELDRAVTIAIERQMPQPEAIGGCGYDITLDPNPQCPQCNGEGLTTTRISDSRALSGNAKLLYAGAKNTKYGVEVLLRDQDAALQNIARHLGMFIERTEVTNNTPVTAVLNATVTDPVEAAKIYQKIMMGS